MGRVFQPIPKHVEEGVRQDLFASGDVVDWRLVDFTRLQQAGVLAPETERPSAAKPRMRTCCRLLLLGERKGDAENATCSLHGSMPEYV